MKIFKILLPLTFIMLTLSCTIKPKPAEKTEKPVPKIRVMLNEVERLDSLSFTGKALLTAEEAQYELDGENSTIYIKNRANGYKIYNKNRIFTFSDEDAVTLQNEDKRQNFIYHGKKYAGDIILTGTPEHSVWIINELYLEKYLKGVVPAEIPTFKKEYLQADKAQAICARTYALNSIQHNNDRQFHLYADVRSQAYGGIDMETEQGNKAVDGTKGVVIKYGKDLAAVYYHSTCGGMLESGSYFGEKYDLPYLQPYKDLLGDEFACSASPYFRWQRSFSFDAIDSLIYINYNKGIKKLTIDDTLDVYLKINILERTRGGRIQKMEIDYADTTITLSGFQIRKFFADNNGNYLPSTMFTLSAADDTTLALNGGGYGHGVGLCQYGALSMAEKGFKYYHILYKYFRGTYLEKIY